MKTQEPIFLPDVEQNPKPSPYRDLIEAAQSTGGTIGNSIKQDGPTVRFFTPSQLTHSSTSTIDGFRPAACIL
jgi:hypothetical protein